MIRPNPSQLSIVLEYAAGGDLSKFLEKRGAQKNPLQEREALVWFAQILSAVDYLHKRDMIHRDIKAANVFISADGATKLGDFNLSKTLECNAKRTSERTCTTPCGTPMYNAPERWLQGGYTQQVDIWSLGCLLYEMLLLQPTFIAANMDALFKNIHTGTFNKAPLASVSPAVKDLLLSMLMHDPRRRPRADVLLKEGILRDTRSYLFVPPEIGGPGLVAPEGAAGASTPRRRSSFGASRPTPSERLCTVQEGTAFLSLETVKEDVTPEPTGAKASGPTAPPTPTPPPMPTPHRPISRPASRGGITTIPPKKASSTQSHAQKPFAAAARATRAVVGWQSNPTKSKTPAGPGSPPLPPIKAEHTAKAVSALK